MKIIKFIPEGFFNKVELSHMLKNISIFISQTNKILKKHTALLIFITTVAIISSWQFQTDEVLNQYDLHLQYSKQILSGTAHDPHYQYRVLRPLIGESIKNILSASGMPIPERALHQLAYFTMLFIAFWFIFYLFYRYLLNYFDQKMSLIGVLLLQLVVPLTTTDYLEGDIITLLFYLISFNLMMDNKDKYIPIAIGIGALNRFQIVFFLFNHWRSIVICVCTKLSSSP